MDKLKGEKNLNSTSMPGQCDEYNSMKDENKVNFGLKFYFIQSKSIQMIVCSDLFFVSFAASMGHFLKWSFTV